MISLLAVLTFTLPNRHWNIVLPPPSHEVYITTYNPTVQQNDSAPCHPASGRNICTAAKEGDKTVAVSRDLLWRNGGPYRWHDKLFLDTRDSLCPWLTGIYSVEDTLRADKRRQIDVFKMNAAENTSCHGRINLFQ